MSALGLVTVVTAMLKRKLTPWLLAASVVGAAAASQGCDVQACTDNLVFGITVRLIGGADGAKCVVDVSAQDGAYQEDFECLTDKQDCFCNGAGERPGTYTVTVSDQGTVLQVDTVVVQDGECHVSPEHLEVDVRGGA
jgi:hypothetical protein